MSKVKVKVTTAAGTVSTEMELGTKLLDGALEQGIPLNFGCKRGLCKKCKVRVTAGTKNLAKPSVAEVKALGDQTGAGFRLACETRVLGAMDVEQK